MNRNWRIYSFISLTPLLLLLTGCGTPDAISTSDPLMRNLNSLPTPINNLTPLPPAAASLPETIEITIMSEVKQAIAASTPEQEYGYYVLKTNQPKKVGELSNMTLLVCGDVEKEKDIEVALSSYSALGTLLFQSSNVYLINKSMSCEGEGPCATIEEDVSLMNSNDEVVAVLHRELLKYGSEMDNNALVTVCTEAMHKNPDSVLLVKKGILGQLDDIVEIIFKSASEDSPTPKSSTATPTHTPTPTITATLSPTATHVPIIGIDEPIMVENVSKQAKWADLELQILDAYTNERLEFKSGTYYPDDPFDVFLILRLNNEKLLGTHADRVYNNATLVCGSVEHQARSIIYKTDEYGYIKETSLDYALPRDTDFIECAVQLPDGRGIPLASFPNISHSSMMEQVQSLLMTSWGSGNKFAKFSPGNLNLGSWPRALAQILYYHRLTPSGNVNYKSSNGYQVDENLDSYKYNWDLFVDKFDNSTTQNSIEEVARYIYYTAIILQVDFGTDAIILSHSERVAAITKHYNSDAKLFDNSSYSLDQIKSRIKEELVVRRPVVMHLRDLSHDNYRAVVVDGFKIEDEKLLVHINMGREGEDDGWYDFDRPILHFNDNAYRKVVTIIPWE